MTLSWRYAAASDVGLLREGNEDAAFAGRRLLAVADGMGGHAAGEVASAAVIAALEQLDELGMDAGDPQEALREAVEEANANLRDMVAADNELHGMGTTVTAVLSDGEDSWLAHVGDSRAYLLRDGELRQVTRDHTFVQQLVDEGRIKPEDASTHPQRNYITRALDGRHPVEMDLDRLEVRPGDRLLLCSDGLSGVVSDESLADVLRDGGDPEDAVRRLVDLALRGGAPDNVTCVVADAVEAPLDARKVVAGAAGQNGSSATVAPSARADGGTPATRAAGLPRTGRPAPAKPAPDPEPERKPTATAVERDGPDPRERARRLRRRRTAIVAVAVLLLLGVGASAGYAWTQKQYYVAADGGAVAIYRGIDANVAGIDLSHVEERVPLPLDTLSEFERARVRKGIHTEGLSDARQVVERLRAAATVPGPVATTPSATPSPPASPSPSTPQATP